MTMSKSKARRVKLEIRRKWDNISAQILVDIIRPLFGDELRDRRISIEDALHQFFHGDTREIYWIRFEQPFLLRGTYWLSTFTRSNSTKLGPREIKKGQIGLLRFDVNDPKRVDIQLLTSNESDHVFSLTWGQWCVIKKKVTVIYNSRLTGKEATRARHLKLYHEGFIKSKLGCGFEFRTATGVIKPDYKGTKG